MSIAVAMSGGVDSSMCALLLKNQGESVIGVTLALWRGSLCCSLEDAGEARYIARSLDIPHYLIDGIEAFRNEIVQPYIHQRLKGHTPNPCVDCNPRFKVDFLWEQLLKRTQADYLATGHYVSKRYNPQTNRYELWQGKDATKDQSYMLWRLTQTQLARLQFPLGEITKKQLREQAAEQGWVKLAQKPDSQDLCFVTPNSRQFWNTNAPEGCVPGPIKDTEGHVIGQHQGRVLYTQGQRRGLNVAAKERLYVTEIQAEQNTVIAGAYADTFCQSLVLNTINWVSVAPWETPAEIFVKTNYRSPLYKAKLTQTGEAQGELFFEQPLSKPALGQSCVFYDKSGRVLGGGKHCVNES